MNKILFILLSLTLLVGCRCTPEPIEETPSNHTTNNEINKETSWYNDFETALEDKNYKYTSKEKLDASLVQGVEGYRYISDYGNIDIYRYENGDNFDQIMKNKRLTIDGVEKNVEINGNYVIVSDGVHEDVLDIFRNMN